MNEPEWQMYLQQFDPSEMQKRIRELPPVGQTTKFCVIVEPRDHPLLLPVLRNFVYLLQPKGWGLIIFHGRNNEQVLRNILSDGNVLLHKMDVDNLTINEYNNLLISAEFWRTLREKWGCENALIFQVDTILLRDNVDDFLQYDYIGAPWKFGMNLTDNTVEGGKMYVGNGGLSLRNCKVMEQIASNCPRTVILLNENKNMTNVASDVWRKKYKKTRIEHEDIFFSYWLHTWSNYFRIPTVEEAMKFSVETLYYPTPCGLHRPNISLFPTEDSFAKLFENIQQISQTTSLSDDDTRSICEQYA